MEYEDLIKKREELQIQLAGVEKELLKFGDPAREILEFLNQKAHRRYRPTASNLRMIRARIKEGFTPEELRQVVAKKCREWRDNPKMNQYLRPATLFNATKFSNYSGELL
jgi:uncharacterized phage protein (TIGR02220 family)